MKASSEKSGQIKINKKVKAEADNKQTRESTKSTSNKKTTVSKANKEDKEVKSKANKVKDDKTKEKKTKEKPEKIFDDDKKSDEYDKDLNINFLEDEPEENFDINDLDKKLKERKKVSKQEGVSIFKNSFYNLIFAGVFILFLVFCNYGFFNIEKNAMIKNINLFSFMFLGVSIMLIETAYKEDKITKCINGIEAILMGILTLFLPMVLQKYTDNFRKVLLVSGIVILVYYIIKSIVAFFLNRRNLLIDKDDIVKEKKDEDEIEDEEDYDD